MQLYPLLMTPYFRHGEQTPWGGSMLQDVFLKDAPDDRTGESLEISALPGCESVVRNGEHAGKALSQMLALWGEALTGAGTDMPLLLKILDARERLSVQVHPDDEDGRPGKSEAWIVLWAEEGAKLVYGLSTEGRPLREIVEAGELESVLRWEPARPGDVFYIPAGTVHALGGGICCYEIQQNSATTYRFWDWGRVGADGQPRALHIEEALRVSAPDRALPKLEGVTQIVRGGSVTHYICDKHFHLMRLNVSGNMPLPEGRMLFVTPTQSMTLTWPGGEMTCAPFDSILVPAHLQGAAIHGDGKALVSATPDREALRAELGYRAENVAGLVD